MLPDEIRNCIDFCGQLIQCEERNNTDTDGERYLEEQMITIVMYCSFDIYMVFEKHICSYMQIILVGAEVAILET